MNFERVTGRELSIVMDPLPNAAVTLPTTGRLAAIDFGTVRIGIALCDSRQTIASPYENYTRRGAAADERFFRLLATSERLAGFVVGLPVHLDGGESVKSREARAFGEWLFKLTQVPLVYFDERFTSVEAERFLMAAEMTNKQRKQRLDKLAAQILLSAYLESQHRTDPPQRLDG